MPASPIIGRMQAFNPEITMYMLAAALLGAFIAWFAARAMHQSKLGREQDEWQLRVDDVSKQRDRLQAEIQTLHTSIEAQQAVVNKHEAAVSRLHTELESAREREKQMTKSIFTLRAEREDFKNKLASFQNALAALKRQSADLQSEFIKSGDFYKAQLAKSFEIRKSLEEQIDNSRREHDSFSNLLRASRSEQESVNKMLAATKARLSSFDDLEQKVVKLEAENARIKHDNAMIQQENAALKRDVAEQDELRVQNKELAQVLTSMEDSRRQYEDDAKRYKEYAGKSEQKSETLRLRLDEVEQNFLEMERQQQEAIKNARSEATVQAANDDDSIVEEVDDLKEIVGIGKVFEHTLHELGIYTFKQVANFGVADIARVNAELKEFKGRMEQDDWIGQAKELYYKKYG